MLRVKVCGITREADALAASKLGVDALGFIFYPGSPRYVTSETAAAIIAKLPGHIARIGVYVSPTPQQLIDDIDQLGLTAVQLHGNYHPDNYAGIGALRLIFAVQTGPRFHQASLGETRGKCAAVLLDGYKKDEYGGTGKTVDWSMAAEIAGNYRTILAGGLNPQNVVAAVRQVRPYAIDVNSGVETAPGIKCHDKMKQIFHHIKEYRDGWKPDSQARFPLA